MRKSEESAGLELFPFRIERLHRDALFEHAFYDLPHVDT